MYRRFCNPCICKGLQRVKKERIYFINEQQVKPYQIQYLTDYFLEKVNPSLVTVILKEEYQDFTDNNINQIDEKVISKEKEIMTI